MNTRTGRRIAGERAALLEQLREQVQASAHRSLLVVVHGFRERFPSALNKTAFLAHVLDANLPFLVFDWPGDQGSTIRGYRRAQRIARESGQDLADLIRLITEEVQPRNLAIVANSMGGEVVVSAFSTLYQNPEMADLEAEIERVVEVNRLEEMVALGRKGVEELVECQKSVLGDIEVGG